MRNTENHFNTVNNANKYVDEQRFSFACACALTAERTAQIGTLHEKALHSTLKFYIDPDPTKHEVKIGRSIADVYNADGIFEIQTRSFNALRKKLEAFLKVERVTVVYPVAAEKRLVWVNKATGDMTTPRRSPKRGSVYDAFYELYKLGELLGHPRLRVLILLIDMDEYRFLDGWGNGGKRGSTRFERVPKAIRSACMLETAADYAALIPAELSREFTSRELSKGLNLQLHRAQNMLTVLSKIGVVRCVGRQGRLKLWTIGADEE